jgi:hypothetical protein
MTGGGSGGREDKLQTRTSVSTSEAGLHPLHPLPCSVTMSGVDNSLKEYDYEYIDLQIQENKPKPRSIKSTPTSNPKVAQQPISSL